MIHQKDFIAAIGEPDMNFNIAMDRALLRIQAEERSPIVKKKLRLSLVAAILALILTGASLAVGINLFEFFGKDDARLSLLAPQAELATSTPESVETAALGTTTASFQNAYYDGESLLVAFTLNNCKRYAPFNPDPEMLARMEKADDRYFGISYDENQPGSEHVLAFLMAMQEGKPCGYTQYSIYPSDHCTTADGTDLPPWQENHTTLENGSQLFLREFESPLPEGARNRDQLELHIKLWQMPSYFYFDGKDCYELYEKNQPAGEITALVPRTSAVTRSYTGIAEHNSTPISAEVQASAVRAEAHIKAASAVFQDPGVGAWFDALLMDENGNILRTNEVDFDTDRAVVRFAGTGALPEQLTLYIGIDCEGEFSKEDFIASAIRINLTPN